MRKIATGIAAVLLAVSVIGAAAPAAEAKDSGWGCGGAC